MNSKVKILLILLASIWTIPVSASNSIDYTLTITDDFEFQEVIKYRIEDYKQRKNGYNYMVDIINKDITADIFHKTFYAKQKELKDNIYYVTLTKTFNEYTLSNSAFLNNCFQNPKYDYDVDKYSFSGTGGFNCYDAISMKLTVITDFKVTSTNATQEGNKYIWYPQNANFTMNIVMDKQYKEPTENANSVYDDIDGNDDHSDNNANKPDSNKSNDNEKSKNKSSVTAYVVVGILMVIAFGVMFVVPVLKAKSKSLNKI